MGWWIVGGWWPGLLLMAAFMVICMLMMGGMMRSMTGMWGSGRTRSARSEANAAEHPVNDGPVRDAVGDGDHSVAADPIAPRR